MATLVCYEAEGSEILIEVDDPAEALPLAYRRKGIGTEESKTFVQAKQGLDAALSSLRAAANSVARTLRSIEVQPEQTTVELALKFTAEAGVIIARTGGEAQMRVAMTWSKARATQANGKKDDNPRQSEPVAAADGNTEGKPQ